MNETFDGRYESSQKHKKYKIRLAKWKLKILKGNKPASTELYISTGTSYLCCRRLLVVVGIPLNWPKVSTIFSLSLGSAT